MGAFRKNVAEVVKRAMRSGHAQNGPYVADYEGNHLALYHYGTLIFEAVPEGVLYVGGYSKSDKDAIETASAVFGHNISVTGSREVAKRKGYDDLGQAFYTKGNVVRRGV